MEEINEMNKLVMIILVLMLGGCGSTKNILVPTTERIVVMPPEHLTSCPDIPRMLTGEELRTQADAARNVEILYNAAVKCRDNLDSTRIWLEIQKEVFEEADK